MKHAWLACSLLVVPFAAIAACGGGDTASMGGAGPGSSSSVGHGGGGGSGQGGDVGAPLADRPYDPIVLVGGQIPGLSQALATDVVAFARKDGAWKQIPVQVDERVLTDFCTIYGNTTKAGHPACGTTSVIEALFYADDGTFTGPDTDPKLDADDEVVLMARDAGERAPAGSRPDGVVAGSGVEIEIHDGAERAFAYLFERTPDGKLRPDAGITPLVRYDFKLVGTNDYKSDYPFAGNGDCGNGGPPCDPPILEDSTITTSRYSRHFAARWVTDGLSITTEGSTGQDILDVAQAKFDPDFCGRHVLTFSTAEGAFVANVNGPLRAIRSYLGANSGPLTERTHLFYQGSEVVETFLRVHAIPGVMDIVDYAPSAKGMTYYNSENTKGFPIDGVPDHGFVDKPQTWDLVTGPHGSVLTRFDHHFTSPAGMIVTGYYEDDAHTPHDQCQDSDTVKAPDAEAFGTSGIWENNPDVPIPVTDPARGGTDSVTMSRSQTYGAAGMSEEDAAAAAARPALEILARPLGAESGPTCGDHRCDAGEATSCPFDCAFDGTCGDGLCDPWENSFNCAKDCGGKHGGGSMCPDGTCSTADENELTCPEDCWTPTFVPVVACFDQSCATETGACAADPGCVALVVCTGDCVAAHQGTSQSCYQGCLGSVMNTSQEDRDFSQTLLACAAGAGCG